MGVTRNLKKDNANKATSADLQKRVKEFRGLTGGDGPAGEYSASLFAQAAQELEALGNNFKYPEKPTLVDELKKELGSVQEHMKKQYNRWLGGYSVQPAWDKGFEKVKQRLVECNQVLDIRIKKEQAVVVDPNAANKDELNKKKADTVKVLQDQKANIKAIEDKISKIQTDTYSAQVEQTTRSVTQQKYSQIAVKNLNRMGYLDLSKGKMWKKVYGMDAEEVEKKIEKERKNNSGELVLSKDKEETWQDKLKKIGGDGVYRSDSSNYYIHVRHGRIQAADAPRKWLAKIIPESFIGKFLASPFLLAASPLIFLGVAAGELFRTEAARASELLAFTATALSTRSITWDYADAKVNQATDKMISETMAMIEQAKKQGLTITLGDKLVALLVATGSRSANRCLERAREMLEQSRVNEAKLEDKGREVDKDIAKQEAKEARVVIITDDIKKHLHDIPPAASNPQALASSLFNESKVEGEKVGFALDKPVVKDIDLLETTIQSIDARLDKVAELQAKIDGLVVRAKDEVKPDSVASDKTVLDEMCYELKGLRDKVNEELVAIKDDQRLIVEAKAALDSRSGVAEIGNDAAAKAKLAGVDKLVTKFVECTTKHSKQGNEIAAIAQSIQDLPEPARRPGPAAP